MTEQLDLDDWLREHPESLTEQWKKGKLKEGKYYVKTQENNLCELMFDDEGYWYDFGWDCWLSDDYVKEVLAPVPSYEEWQDTENRSLLTAEFSNEIDELNEENQQLKELLKECLNDVNHIISKVHLCKELLDLKNKIDNAIGEK